MTTIAEVAERAGVGAATVSRVLNDSSAVSETTRRRVQDAIAELGYQRNATARALSTGRTAMLGVVAPFLALPSVIGRLRGVSRALAGTGYRLVLFDVAEPRPVPEILGGAQVDGLLCISLVPSDADLARLEDRGVTVVLVDGEHPRLPSVAIDDVEGGRLAAQHLVGLGHRHVAFVGDDERNAFGFTSSRRRRTGAAQVVEAAGGRFTVRQGPPGQDSAEALAADLLRGRQRPSAIFAASDEQALGVLAAAEEAGVAVPEDLSVVGFDDVGTARFTGLTTVRQPLERSGAEGAALLLEGLDGRGITEARRLPLELVVRTSTAPRTAAPASSTGGRAS